MNTVGDRLKKLRKEHKFTQEQIADYLNFNQGQITKLEKNKRNLKMSSLNKLCELYQCSPEYILESKGKYSKPNLKVRTDNKDMDLTTIAEMNKIIMNLKYLSTITKKL